MDLNEIKALIALIDDPDDAIFEQIRDRLMSAGPDAVKLLENSWEELDYGLLFQNRIEQIIHDIQFEETKHQLTRWYEGSEKDLLKGALIVAKYQYPGLDEQQIYQFFDRLKRDCWLELNQNMTAFENVRVLNKIIFGQYHFSGNSKNYNSPLNSFINTIIETRKGNPLGLSIVYSIVAQRLELPIYGVNLPNHFVLAYMDTQQINPFISNENKYGVLFYINPFSKGSMLQREDILQFLASLQIQPNAGHFEPCSNSEIIRRMITNLIASFQQVGNSEKVEELIILRQLLD